ncbi:HDIG domain-containing protein [Clostridium gasigenes]|uniref:HDIG domain-containing metalloprotein n=1 Tax=Clostridium gasigenes TaxID=94869 RepID=UPI0014383098|nr:HDIG domain-containing metalloprotein [Clostridium gasigenes]MBU3131447.1 HDIG domain-containing protein [Clostridium gasigenes]NKF08345.1 HDIG domain-containing protein [Clostridium gasigenes]QSW18690.1 HDIG domain-containing protein [Clostridium gasigenes]
MKETNIFKEIEKNLQQLEKPSEFLNKLKDSQEFKESSFKVLGDLVNTPQELKYHPEGNVWNHLCMVVDAASVAKFLSYNKREFIWAALLHDLGKLTTTIKRNGRWTSYNHDTEGYNMVKSLLIKETGDEKFAEKVAEIVKFHMHHIYILKNLPFGNIKELLETNNINDILLLFACDKLGRGGQTSEDKKRMFEEVLRILDILEKKSGIKYNDARENIIRFKEKIVNE